MYMFVEIHILQNFAPSNLNRDDTGAPKECMFGATRRARISSQCLKRAIRTRLRDAGLVPDDDLAFRTKRVVDLLAKELQAMGHAQKEAELVASSAIQSSELPADSRRPKLTAYLLFLGREEVRRMAEICNAHWDVLLTAQGQASGARATREERKQRATSDVGRAIEEALKAGSRDGHRAVDLALFGRMVADMPEVGVDACCQVAHAISTHQVEVESDFYTAVDDIRPEETEGADMMGTVEFNSACYYRYANLNPDALSATLGDRVRARHALGAWLHATIDAVPTGKQNSMAAWSRPSLVLTVLRDGQPCSLANAFVPPVRISSTQRDLIAASVASLDRYWGDLQDMYGDDGLRGAWVATTHGSLIAKISAAKCTKSELVERTVAATFDQLAG
jgi:CRISPR system Cascade subunit CasC